MSCRIFDPFGASPRSPFMFTHANTLQSPRSPATLALAGRAQMRAPTIAGQQRVAQAPTTDGMKWIALMAKVRDHQDTDAFAALFAHFAPRVKGFLINSGADATTAEECAQEVMTTLWQKAHQFDPSRASVSTWIFTIARNRRIDLFRRQRRPQPEDLSWGPEAEPDQADVLSLQQETDQLNIALAALPQAQRDLIEKAYYGDLSQSEIAKLTGLPLGTIKSRIRLALDRLRHAMK